MSKKSIILLIYHRHKLLDHTVERRVVSGKHHPAATDMHTTEVLLE
jgi:hypothetical protein